MRFHKNKYFKDIKKKRQKYFKSKKVFLIKRLIYCSVSTRLPE